MVTTRFTLGPLTLICLTLLQISTSASLLNSVKSMGMVSSFGFILPAAAGVGVHFLEKKIALEHRGSWRQDEHLKLEAVRLMNTCIIGILTTCAWGVLKGMCDNDIRISSALMAAYCYGQGRALYMQRQSLLQKGSSYLFPATLGVLAYSRIPDLAPQLDIAVKSLLVFGFSHNCGM